MFDMRDPENYGFSKDAKNCLVGVMYSPNVPDDTAILGTQFLKKYYMVFDLMPQISSDNKQMTKESNHVHMAMKNPDFILGSTTYLSTIEDSVKLSD